MTRPLINIIIKFTCIAGDDKGESRRFFSNAVHNGRVFTYGVLYSAKGSICIEINIRRKANVCFFVILQRSYTVFGLSKRNYRKLIS